MIYEEYESIWNTIRKKEKELFDLINKRNELKAMLNMKEKSFVCEMWRIKKGIIEGVYYKGKRYKVFIYEEEE